jgi:hypothetical protein
MSGGRGVCVSKEQITKLCLEVTPREASAILDLLPQLKNETEFAVLMAWVTHPQAFLPEGEGLDLFAPDFLDHWRELRRLQDEDDEEVMRQVMEVIKGLTSE